MIDKLKLRISELEAEKEVQNERHQELILEMAELKKYGPESIASDIEGKWISIYVQKSANYSRKVMMKNFTEW